MTGEESRTDDPLELALREVLDSDAQRVKLKRPYWDQVVATSHEGHRTKDGSTLHHRPRDATDSRWSSRRPRVVIGAMTAGIIVVVLLAVAFVVRTPGEPAQVASRSGTDTRHSAGSPTDPATTMPDPSTTTVSAPSTIGPVDPDLPTAVTTTTVLGSPQPTLGPADPLTQPPVTTVGQAQIYYRFAPDIDLAWVLDGDRNMLCWRTPVDERCVLEPRPGGDGLATTVVPTAPSTAAILVLDTEPGVRSEALSVISGEGASSVVRVHWDDPQTDIGIARVDLAWDDIEVLGRA